MKFHFASSICIGAMLLIAASATPAIADIQLPGVFSDRMVIQQGERARIWGLAEPNEQLQLRLGENSAATQADASGHWSCWITPPPAGGPYQLVISGTDAQVVFNDVLVGEVWLCSGQSNMEWSITQSTYFPSPEEFQQYLGTLVDTRLRLLTVPKAIAGQPSPDFAESALWQNCTAEEVAEFSATAYYFAQALRRSERLANVPIGLIDASWGGTPGESWVSRDALNQATTLAPLLHKWDEDPDERSPHRPASLFNGMIAPVVPFTIRGVIWYQGEANVGRASQYQTILSTLIQDWRQQFGQGDIPFYMVQLAPFRYTDQDPAALPEVWEAQQAALALPNVAIAPTGDIGDPAEIHPRNKEFVGQRLAAIARNLTYGELDVCYQPPQFAGAERIADSSRMRIRFAHCDELRCQNASPCGFQICGEDQQFVDAMAEIDNGTVVVWSPQIKNPVAVRYLWCDTACCDLFNAGGLPAMPFRSDTFPLLSAGKDY
jgi:sialate O-acetylesterase